MQPPFRFLLLDTKPKNPNHYICLAVRDALTAAGVHVTYVKYEDAIRKAIDNNCNVFLAFDGEEMHYDVCAKLSSLCDVSIIWLTDDPYEAAGNREAAELFDLVYTNDRASVSRYGKRGRHLPFAGCKRYHYRDVQTEDSGQLRYDVLFIGAAWPNRVNLLQSLLNDLKGRRFKIALSPVALHPIKLPLPESSYLWRTSAIECARLANRSRITLALHRDFSTSPGGASFASTPPPRVFEAAMAGTLQLYDQFLTETGEYFEQGKELVSYSSPADCAKTIEYFLSHPSERDELARAAQQKALAHHSYDSRIRVIIEDLNAFRVRRSTALVPQPSRPRLLFVTHNIRPAGNFGGVEVYQEGLAEELRANYEIFFYYRDRRKGPNTFILSDSKYNALDEIRFDNECLSSALSVPIKENVFATLLTTYRIDLIHFHHLVNHPASLVLISAILDIPSVLTLQDFWVMCDNHNLVNYRRRYCDIPNQPDIACDICTDSRIQKPRGTQAVRRAVFSRVLASAGAVIGNTPGYNRSLARFYPGTALSDRAHAIPLPVPSHGKLIQTITPAGNRILRVAILGNFTFEKGADTMIYALNQLRDDAIEFTIFGRVDSPYDKSLAEMNFPNLKIHGQYHYSELPRLLHGNELALHVSIWPETYCIALSEAWQNGLAPIVTAIGALDERVVDGVNGWKIPPDNSAALLDLLRRLLAHPEMIDQVRRRIAGMPDTLFDSEAKHAGKLTEVYTRLLARASQSRDRVPKGRFRSRLTLFDAGIIFNRETWARLFEIHREATTVREWIVSRTNPYVSPADRTDIIALPPEHSVLASDIGGRHANGLPIEQLTQRLDQLERAVGRNGNRLEEMYHSRIWKALCAGGAVALRIQRALQSMAGR